MGLTNTQACCNSHVVKNHTHVHLGTKCIMDNPDKTLLEMCRKHLNNMALYTASSHFGSFMIRVAANQQIHRKQIVLLSTTYACEYRGILQRETLRNCYKNNTQNTEYLYFCERNIRSAFSILPPSYKN